MENISDLKRFSAKVNSTAITPREVSQSCDLEAKTIEIMDSLARTIQIKPDGSLSDEPQSVPRKKPLRDPWQIKWLDLEVTSPCVQTLADEAQAFAFAWFRMEPCRLKIVSGDVGLGKTHVSRRLAGWARAVAFERWLRVRAGGELPTVAFRTARMLSPRKCNEAAFEEHMAEMESASMVILDDLGTEIDDFKTGGPAERLCHILNRLEGRYLWMSTNRAPSAWASTWDIRVEDRLLSGDVVTLSGPSYRSEIR